ncbi:protein regulator of cytokinesis 1-like isoform X1 [Paramacrobiotus metropolitanus]|uniref:protein regulator of cytokinesis 1-like isoform X1 n=1 Tax=Paramacrobiotus metropolitanus TaxID=2943436 RepID=UPI00244652FE|nr:protein regulator of cytokinesis 1-like isoform X1 [Paramacrobiotus metropolitanus]
MSQMTFQSPDDWNRKTGNLSDLFRLNDEQKDITKQIEQCWDSIGLSDDDIRIRVDVLQEAYYSSTSWVLNKGLKTQQDYQRDLLKSIDDCKAELVNLEHYLGVTCKPDDQKASHMKMVDLEKYYREELLQPLLIIKEDRKKMVDRLQAENDNYAGLLGVERFHVSDPGLLYRTDVLDRLAKVNDAHLIILNRRRNIMAARRDHIRTIAKDLKVDISHVNLEDFSDHNMTHTEAFEKQMVEKKRAAEEQGQSLLDRIQYLSKRMDLPTRISIESSDVVDHLCDPDVIAKLQGELAHLEIMKKENLNNFVEQLRAEIKDLYNKCFTGPEEQQKLIDLKSDTGTYDEASLEEHEKECNRLRDLYKQNIEFFSKIVRREEVWKKKMELDEKESDPARLLNRGGQLLRDQQEKARVEHELKKLDAELVQKTHEWEGEHKRPFTVYGRIYEEFVDEQRSAYQAQQENKKEERRRAKEKEQQGGAQLGKRKNEFNTGKLEVSKLVKGSAGSAAHAGGGGLMVRSPMAKGKRPNGIED